MLMDKTVSTWIYLCIHLSDMMAFVLDYFSPIDARSNSCTILLSTINKQPEHSGAQAVTTAGNYR